MIRCSFCEEPLACKTCGKPFRPQQSEAYVAVYQPDVSVLCPECQNLLLCRHCGFIYGDKEEEEPEV